MKKHSGKYLISIREAGAFHFRVENCGLGYNNRVKKLIKIGRESNDSRRH